MAASKRFMNWTSVGFTPTAGTLTTYTGVTEVEIDNGGTLLKFSGDGDRYNTTVVNSMNEPKATVKAADLAAIHVSAVGTVGVFTATHNDSKAGVGVGSGAMTYTLSNAVVETISGGGSHAAWGAGSIGFSCYSTDGITSPLAIVIA